MITLEARKAFLQDRLELFIDSLKYHKAKRQYARARDCLRQARYYKLLIQRLESQKEPRNKEKGVRNVNRQQS